MRNLRIVILLLGLFVITACSVENRGGFAIYLLADGITPQELPVLSHLELIDPPLLTEQDIISYQKSTHEIELSAIGVDKLQQMDVPVSGIAFAICVDREPIYTGAFWAAYSSLSYDGVVIDPTLVSPENPVIQVNLGYPGASFYRGDDPRSDPRIITALEKAGVLK